MSKGCIYIAGPMTGIPKFNCHAFDRAARVFEDYGFDVVNPAQEDRDRWGEDFFHHCPTGDPKEIDNMGIEFSLREVLGHDLKLIADKCDHIYMLAGWEKSTGAKAEHALAVALGIQIWYQNTGA